MAFASSSTPVQTHKLPIQTYFAFEQPAKEEQFQRTFVHVACRIGEHFSHFRSTASPLSGATEAEEVGVEHLLRDFQGGSTSTLTSMIQDKLTALKQLAEKLHQIADYLEDVANEKSPVQPHLLTQFQRLLNALPDKTDADGFKDAFQLATNDAMLSSYVGKPLTAGKHTCVLPLLTAFAARLVLQVNELVRFKLSKRVGELNKGVTDGQKKNKVTDGEEKTKTGETGKDGDKTEKPKDSPAKPSSD